MWLLFLSLPHHYAPSIPPPPPYALLHHTPSPTTGRQHCPKGLVTDYREGGGGYKTGGGGHVKIYPYEKGGGGGLAMLKGGGGHTKCWGSFYAVA